MTRHVATQSLLEAVDGLNQFFTKITEDSTKITGFMDSSLFCTPVSALKIYTFLCPAPPPVFPKRPNMLLLQLTK